MLTERFAAESDFPLYAILTHPEETRSVSGFFLESLSLSSLSLSHVRTIDCALNHKGTHIHNVHVLMRDGRKKQASTCTCTLYIHVH